MKDFHAIRKSLQTLGYKPALGFTIEIARPHTYEPGSGDGASILHTFYFSGDDLVTEADIEGICADFKSRVEKYLADAWPALSKYTTCYWGNFPMIMPDDRSAIHLNTALAVQKEILFAKDFFDRELIGCLRDCSENLP